MKLLRISIVVTIILSNFGIEVHGDNSEMCGRRLVNHEALIVNGNESKEGYWPWNANILHVEINHQNIQFKCGGTLLNSDSILTAAHCVYENGRPIVPHRVLIQLGRYNLKISGVHGQEMEVYQVFPHHSFNATSLANDIAIVRVATKVIFNNYVQPICLWDANKDDLLEVVGKYGTIVGFGITEEDRISYTLRQAVIPVVGLTTCLASDPTFFANFLSETTFCAGYRNGTTACNGDSGGSLTFEEDGVYRIRGLVSLTQIRPGSHDQYCKTDQYVVFTDVAKYLNWIREIVPGLPSIDSQNDPSVDEIKYCYFLNNDLTDARIARDLCEERCTVTPYCTHFTWTDYEDGTCWMKQNTVTMKDAHQSLDKEAVCGIIESSAHIAWNEHGDWAFGCDFWENDLADVKSTSKQCSNQCSLTSDCTHFTWTDYEGGTCWMKTNLVGKKDAYIITDKSAVCGIAKRINWNGNKWAMGCDFRGNDVQDVRSRSEDCAAKCATNPQCTHFNWDTAFGGTCWMKQYSGVSKDDAVLSPDASSMCGLA